VSETRVQRVLRLSEEDVGLLLGMGPSAHHAAGPDPVERSSSIEVPEADADLQGVTIDVMIHVLRRRERNATA
jgi:23S rRNA (guanine745-N1)-methyltransferase